MYLYIIVAVVIIVLLIAAYWWFTSGDTVDNTVIVVPTGGNGVQPPAISVQPPANGASAVVIVPQSPVNGPQTPVTNVPVVAAPAPSAPTDEAAAIRALFPDGTIIRSPAGATHLVYGGRKWHFLPAVYTACGSPARTSVAQNIIDAFPKGGEVPRCPSGSADSSAAVKALLAAKLV